MKRLFLMVAMVSMAFIFTTHEAKAQSAVGMGPGMIYHTNYNGAVKYFAKGVKVGTMIWWMLATAGVGLMRPVVFDEPYVDVKGKLHLPLGAVLYDEYENDVTDMVGGIVIAF